MNAIQRFVWAAAVLVVAATPILAAPKNIAPQAKITSNSEHSGSHAAKLVADGKIPSLGGCNGAGLGWAAKGNKHPGGVSLAVNGAKPGTVAEGG